jgi:hypothetical protein
MEMMAQFGSGAVAQPLAGIAGLVASLFGGTEAGTDVIRHVSDKLTYEPRTESGQAMSHAANAPLAWLDEKAGNVGGRVSDVAGPAAGAATKAALELAPAFAAKGVKPGANFIANSLEKARAPAAKLAAPAMDVIDTAKANNLVLPPTAVNPSPINSFLESWAGKIKTEQSATLKNSPRVNEAARRHGGIPEGDAITPEALEARRAGQRTNYDAVRGVGEVPVDAEFAAVRDNLSSRTRNAGQSFDVADDMAPVVRGMTPRNGTSFDANAAVDQIYLMRGKAKEAFRAGKTDLGNAYKDGATALEDQISRHLEATGADPALVDNFRQARENIAKTFDVEDHLTPGGNVDIAGLANSKRRGALTGEMADLADVATEYPKAMRTPEKVGSVTMGSPLMHYAGAGMSALKGKIPLPEILSLMAQAPVRGLILSKPYQSMFVNHPAAPGLIERIMRDIGGPKGEPPPPVVPPPAPPPPGSVPFQRPDIAGMKAENMALAEPPKPFGNEIPFDAGERALGKASAIDTAQAIEQAKKADAARRMDFVYEDHPVANAVADNLKTTEPPKPFGNEIDPAAFLRERAESKAVKPAEPETLPGATGFDLSTAKPVGAAAEVADAPRDATARVVGTVYKTPRGNLKWDGERWQTP